MGFPPHSVFLGRSEDEMIMIHSCVFEHDRQEHEARSYTELRSLEERPTS